MINKILLFCASHRQQFTKYFIVGISGLVIDIATLIFLKEVVGLTPVTSVVVNQIIVLFYNFTLNKYWSFKNKALPHKQIVKYFILASFNYSFAVIMMAIFNGKLEVDYRLVRICTIAVMVSWNFFILKYWVYKKTPNNIQAINS